MCCCAIACRQGEVHRARRHGRCGLIVYSAWILVRLVSITANTAGHLPRSGICSTVKVEKGRGYVFWALLSASAILCQCHSRKKRMPRLPRKWKVWSLCRVKSLIFLIDWRGKVCSSSDSLACLLLSCLSVLARLDPDLTRFFPSSCYMSMFYIEIESHSFREPASTSSTTQAVLASCSYECMLPGLAPANKSQIFHLFLFELGPFETEAPSVGLYHLLE